MAWRRYHIPIDDEWIALGDEHGFDLRQADVITFAMPPIVATKFPTPVSIIAAPVAKGLLISTNIAAGYHEQDSIMLRVGNLILRILFITRQMVLRMPSLLTIKLFMGVNFV